MPPNQHHCCSVYIQLFLKANTASFEILKIHASLEAKQAGVCITGSSHLKDWFSLGMAHILTLLC